MTTKQWTGIKEKTFYFIRHGQTDWNAKHQAMGITDIPLNLTGEEQSQAAIAQFEGLKISTICHSPLKRASRTAEILNEALHCELHPIEELKEFNLGENTGKVIGKWFDEWIEGNRIPGGETFKEFVERALLGLNKALEHKGPILIVAHGGIYWAIQRAIEQLQIPDLPNCLLASFNPPNFGKPWECLHYPKISEQPSRTKEK